MQTGCAGNRYCRFLTISLTLSVTYRFCIYSYELATWSHSQIKRAFSGFRGWFFDIACSDILQFRSLKSNQCDITSFCVFGLIIYALYSLCWDCGTWCRCWSRYQTVLIWTHLCRQFLLVLTSYLSHFPRFNSLSFSLVHVKVKTDTSHISAVERSS